MDIYHELDRCIDTFNADNSVAADTLLVPSYVMDMMICENISERWFYTESRCMREEYRGLRIYVANSDRITAAYTGCK